jgi:hypothetical protein
MTTNPLTNLTIRDLKNAIALRERIDALREDLDRLVNLAPSSRGRGKRVHTKHLGAGNTAIEPQQHSGQRGPKKRRKLGRAARARLSAMAKARWAKAKARGRNRL